MEALQNTVEELGNSMRSRLLDMYPQTEVDSFIELGFRSYLGFAKTDIILNKRMALAEPDVERFQWLVKELQAHRPIQYILGECEFFGLRLNVSESVLIPRPETEELVDWIVKGHRPQVPGERLEILDIGTGSGCIAIALAHHFSEADVTATDISEEALQIARKNAVANNVKLSFHQADVTEPETHKPKPTAYNIIASNPPYVLESEKRTIEPNVLEFEPHVALFVSDNDPLKFYEHITNFALNHLKKNGHLFFEINESMGQQVAELLHDKGFKDIKLKKDINGKERMVRGGV